MERRISLEWVSGLNDFVKELCDNGHEFLTDTGENAFTTCTDLTTANVSGNDLIYYHKQ